MEWKKRLGTIVEEVENSRKLREAQLDDWKVKDSKSRHSLIESLLTYLAYIKQGDLEGSVIEGVVQLGKDAGFANPPTRKETHAIFEDLAQRGIIKLETIIQVEPGDQFDMAKFEDVAILSQTIWYKKNGCLLPPIKRVGDV